MWTEVFTVFQKYMGTGLIMIWFAAALVFLFLTEKNRTRRILLVYYPVVMLLLYFNPLFADAFCRLVGSEIYFRVCWLLPVSVVLAYSTVLLAEHFKGKMKGLFLAAVLTVIVLSGRPVYSNPLYSVAQNEYHVPDSVVHICDAIRYEGREVKAAFPYEMLLYVRQYSPFVCMPYGRDMMLGDFNDLFSLIQRDRIDVKELAELMNQQGCHYAVFAEKKEILGEPQDFDLKLFDTIDGYVIYQNLNLPLEY